ncbi:MAG: protein kinase [Acidobacteriia bacterium]|nr:protein kinase [Terriglobia bacterium]
MKTVLIVDSDLGFAFWLGQGLDEAGYHAFPAKNVADATALPDELKATVDLVIVNPALSGAAEFIETFRRRNEGIKVVGLRGDPTRLPAAAARIDLWCRKPESRHPFQRRQWIERVEELLPVNLCQKRPRGAALGNLLPFEMLSGWLWERLSGSPGPSALAADSAGSEALEEPQPDPARIVAWKEWEGLVIDGQFALRRHLGGAGESAVFLTQIGGPAPRNAAIKLQLAGSATTEAILSRWERAAELSHPGLIQLLQAGSCRLGEIGLAYLVMEYAEESVAEVLSERPLTADEAREMLEPVLDALQYAHQNGFVHGRLKPSNILALGNTVKISSDGLRPAGEAFGAREPGVYDPPESAHGSLSAPGDVWSLGVTLVEALTLRLPFPEGPQGKRAALPEALPPAFREIVLQSLRPDPLQRETVAEISSRLHGTSLTLGPRSGVTPRMPFVRWVYAVAAAAAAVALSAVLTGPAGPQRQLPPASTEQQVMQPAPGPQRVADRPAARQILEQVLPEVSAEARHTLRGTLLVTVGVQVNSSGLVVSAHLNSPGPSPYFASRALQAAQRWKFAPLGLPAPSRSEDWILQFRYSAKGTEAAASPVRP